MPGEDVDYGHATIRIDIDGSGAAADGRAAGNALQRALLNQTRRIGEQMRRQIQRGLNAAAVTVRVDPDLSRFDAKLLAGLQGIDSLNIPVAPDVTGFEQRLRALLAGIEVPVRVVPDMSGFDARIRAHRPPTVTVPVNTNVDANRLTRALGALGGIAGTVGKTLLSGLKFGAIGIAAASAVQSVVGLSAALASLSGITAAVPAAIAGSVAAFGALSLALSGVGDAFSAALSGDSKEFQAALEELSPKAQGVAREIRRLKPAFEDLKESVQDAFFGQITDQITSTAKALGGPLKSGLSGIAVAWGAAAKHALEYVKSGEGVANVKSILGGARKAVDGLSQTTNKITGGFLQMAGVISDAFGDKLATGITNVGNRFGQFMQNAAKSGAAVRWVDTAVHAFAQFGSIIGNVGKIIYGVFRASNISGAGFLANVQEITKNLADFVNSAKGQIAISNLFGAIGQIAAQLGPILGAAVTQIGAIAPALTPIFTALGPTIVNLINALGPGLAAIAPALATVGQAVAQGLAAIGPALGPLGVALAQVLTSLAPILPLAGQLVAVLAQALAPVLSTLAAALTPVISQLVGALAPILPVLAQAFVQLVQALAPLVTGVGQALGQLIAGLGPVLLVVAQAVAQVVIALAPLIAQILGALMPILPPLIDAFLQIVNAVVPLIPPIAELVAALVPLAGVLIQLAAPILEIAAAFVSWLAVNAVVPVIQAIVGVLTDLVGGVTGVVEFVKQLPGMIMEGLSSLASTISEFFTGLVSDIGEWIPQAFDAVVGFFRDLPGKIMEGLAALPGILYEAFTSAVAYLIIALAALLAGVVYTFVQLPVDIYNAVLGVKDSLVKAFVAGFNWVTTTGTQWVNSTVSWFQQLPGRIGAGLSALGTYLVRSFVSAFNTTTSKISSWFTSSVDFFRRLPGQIGSALSSLPGKLAGAFDRAVGAAKTAALNVVSSLVSVFAGLPGKIMGAIGNLGSKIMSKVTSGLPAGVRKYLPFADGGIVLGPTHALIGEAGPEVVIPLTKPRRAAQLAAQSGLLDMLGVTQARTMAAAAGGGDAAAGSAVSTLRSLLSGIAGLLDSVGVNVVLGMVAGIRDNLGLVAAAAEDMAGAAVTAAQTTLQIASPSKVFAKIGQDTGRGFIEGLTGTAAQIKSTAEKLAKDIISAFSGKKQTALRDRLVGLVDSGNKRLTALAAQRDALAQRIADANKFAAETTKKALDAFSLQSLTQGAEKITAQNITAGLEAAVKQVKTFSAQLDDLARRGLRKDLLEQIVGLGPEQGAALAAALSSSTKESLKRINSLQGQLATVSNKLGQTSADVLYDAGAQAGKGFLTGLKAQQKDIEKLMLDIAKGMQKAIRAALQIKSPSRVFMKIGDLTGLGLHVGFLRRLAGLQDASRAAARDLADGVAAQLGGLGGRGKDAVVIPLTRAQRLRQAGEGAPGSARRDGTGSAASGAVHNHTWNLYEVGSADVTAHRVVNRLVLAAGL
ncbi:hypothetical protein ACFY20_44605 [Streptomyces sp. NPDC001312]|uniref:hypothetical protein n=1 Tax=Streptomyces sp. NPDC001312 TaxID=3364561 RepID=UPI0036B1045B